jgi:YVTN family beta-propeller protein
MSNTRPFTVLIPNTSPIDDVIASIGTNASAKSCAVTPDGALCYTVSPDGDVVVPVDVSGQTAYPSIAVGDQPVGIVISPDGTFAYIANFNSGTVSVINTQQGSSDFNHVVSTITVGTNPVDLAVVPDGGRLMVVNAGPGNVSVVDTDASSAAYNQVIGTVGGMGARSVVVSPDGARIYVGTTTGFFVVDANSYAVIASSPTSGNAKSLAITPDGTLLFILLEGGSILVVDVVPGSSSENEVIASVGTTSGKSVVVSADGTLLYVIQDNSNEVLVFTIDVTGGVSAVDPNGAAPSFSVAINLLHAVSVGSDPSDVAIDPSGTGSVFVTDPGSKTIIILNGSSLPQGPVHADIRVTPRTLNLQSNGKYVMGRIRLPAQFSVHEIDLNSVRLQQVIPIVPGKSEFDEEDGIEELHVKFDRSAFQAILPQGEFVPVTIDGMVRNRMFVGEDTIRTIRPTVTHPHAGEYLTPGVPTTITWTGPQGPTPDKADVHVSLDAGETWSPVAEQVSNTGAVPWAVPSGFYEHCRVLVTLWKHGDLYAQGMSDEFMIAVPLATSLKSIDLGLEDGAAVLRWETNYETGMNGFAIVRSESEAGDYRVVTSETIRGSGNVTGGRYEYRDVTIHANRTYWYKLQEVTSDGLGAEFGPYSVVYRLSYALEQNMPNPFNPTTTIKYALAADGDVSLIVYDVGGRRVRDLVNGRQRADVYRVVWDGRNDHGSQVASGVYFYKLVAGKFTQTKKMMLLK